MRRPKPKTKVSQTRNLKLKTRKQVAAGLPQIISALLALESVRVRVRVRVRVNVRVCVRERESERVGVRVRVESVLNSQPYTPNTPL